MCDECDPPTLFWWLHRWPDHIWQVLVNGSRNGRLNIWLSPAAMMALSDEARERGWLPGKAARNVLESWAEERGYYQTPLPERRGRPRKKPEEKASKTRKKRLKKRA